MNLIILKSASNLFVKIEQHDRVEKKWVVVWNPQLPFESADSWF